MKRISIKTGKIGMVYRNDEFQRVITLGKHWLGFSETVVVYNLSTVYAATDEFMYVVRDNRFLAHAEVIEIGDKEIVLKYNQTNLKGVLTSGTYFYFKGILDNTFRKVDLTQINHEITKDKSLMQNPLMFPFRMEYKVESEQEGLLFVNGTFETKLAKGLHYFLKGATPVEVMKVDTRQILMEVSGQEILTKDKAALRVNFQASYKVVDAVKALIHNKDFEKQLYSLVQLALREFLGTLTLDELLEAKAKISEFVLEALKTRAVKLGVEVLEAGIRDIILPGEVREIMNRVLIAQKTAEANSIVRREETSATRNLLNTAKLMEDNAMLFKLKEMEYMEKIAEKIGEITVSSGGQVMEQLTKIFTK